MLKTAFDLLLAALPGLVFAGAVVGLYWTARHGVPAATAKVKAWWTAGKADLTNLKGDVAAFDQRLIKVEQQLGIAGANQKALAAAPAQA